MNLSEKITSLISGHPPTDTGDNAAAGQAASPWPKPAPPQMSSPSPELAVHKFLAELDRYEVETRVAARESEARRKSDRLDQWILLALVVVVAIALVKMDPEEWPRYVSPTLIGGVLFRLVWVTRRRGNPPDSG
jgi:hypothetical protein